MATDAGPIRAHSSSERAATARSKETNQYSQVVQHFFTKAALTIVSSRINLPQTFVKDSTQIKSNRWFNLILDESEVLSKELEEWANADVFGKRPQPLVIEFYLDAAELTRNQTLVIIDDRGRRWDVCEMLSSPSVPTTGPRNRKTKNTQVVIERWKLSLGDPGSGSQSGSNDSAPNVYKKALVMFRTLYTYARFLPAWKFGRRIAKQPATLTSLRPEYRIIRGESTNQSNDLLNAPLYPTGEPTISEYQFRRTHSPAGPLCIDVLYRTNCDFRVDDSEALLSSHFNRMDDSYFRPSLEDNQEQDLPYLAGGKEVGSLPVVDRRGMQGMEQNQAYGSMSTFHKVGRQTGTSPISALRAAGDLTSDSPSSSPQKLSVDRRPQSGSGQSTKPSEVGTSFPRRTSVSFQPFKAGSLSSSPANISSSPKSISGKPSNISSGLAQARGISPLIAEPQTVSKPSVGPEIAVATPSSGSPKGASGRYSSSFGHRRSRLSSGGGTSKGEEDNSSGKTSLASSHQPGSGLLAEAESGSTGSVQNDDDNISDFLKLVEQNKDLKSLNRTDEASRDASTRRTNAALSKFKGLQSSHTALTDSLSSSMMLQRSSGSSSRQLSGVPPALAGASVSTSSSPGKPISPHTPHYPAVPSRLSMPATVQDSEARIQRDRSHLQRDRSNTDDAQISTETAARGYGSTAIDIPTSPQNHPFVGRSISAAHHERVIEDTFGMRSASVPSGERDVMNISELLTLQEPATAGEAAQTTSPTAMERAPSQGDPVMRGTVLSTSSESHDGERRLSVNSASTGSGRPPIRGRVSRGGGRGSTSSFSARGGSGALAEDDEPFLFAMTDIGQSRRSLEENQGTSGTRGRDKNVPG